MNKLARFLLNPVAVALLAVPGAHAATIAGDAFDLIRSTATFGSFPQALAADGPTLRFDVQVARVPEPASGLIVLGGLGLLGLLRRHRR